MARRSAAGLVAAVLLALGSVACGSTTEAAEGRFEPAEPGVLAVATALPAPGFWDGDDAGSLDGGFEWGLARALADEFDLELEVRDIAFGAIVSGRLDGADLALAQVTITDERDDVVDFSTSYLTSSPTILSAAEADDVTDLATARDLRWAVQRDTTEEAFLDDVVRPEDSTLLVDDIDAAAEAVRSGEAEAALLDLPTALILAESMPALRVVARFDAEEFIAAALPRDSVNTEAVDKALRGLLADGTIDDLRERYLIPRFSVDPDELPVIATR